MNICYTRTTKASSRWLALLATGLVVHSRPLIRTRNPTNASVHSSPIWSSGIAHASSVATASKTRSEAPIQQESKSHSHENISNRRKNAALLTLQSCSGCGSAVQTLYPGEAGYFSPTRKAVKRWIIGTFGDSNVSEHLEHSEQQDTVLEVQHGKQDEKDLERMTSSSVVPTTPVCDRCHQLVFHQNGVPIDHPSLRALADTVAESPYRYNHVYHIVDATDFPLSLVPEIHRALSTAPQRSRNRRAGHAPFRRGRKIELSFIITKTDLIAPKKEQVDALMPYFIEVLREALICSGKDVRLGNVRCVSAKRGWWTPVLKEEIWNRGGGGWMIGKANVGKSNLFEVVYPKGRQHVTAHKASTGAEGHGSQSSVDLSTEIPKQYMGLPEVESSVEQTSSDAEVKLPGLLLPPARLETPYPEMPTISSLPGTTASPIRIPFGSGKGELVDLPGLARSDLDRFVTPLHRGDLMMQSRIVPKQIVIKPGQSLLLGGLFRITPKDPTITVLAYPFLPFMVHLTATEKAIAHQQGLHHINAPFIAEEHVSEALAIAGTFPLRWDVTKQRAGPLTSRSAVNARPEDLAFQVLSADILIEGSGWVELVTQVRRNYLHASEMDIQPPWSSEQGHHVLSNDRFPEVEVFSPYGKYVGSRKPMGAWILGCKNTLSRTTSRTRPRRSMSSKGMSTRVADIS